MAGDLTKYFRIEARELTASLSDGILKLETPGGVTAELVGKLLRLAHTLKGAARVVKQSEIGDAAHSIEELLAPSRDSSEPVTRRVIEQLLHQLDIISRCAAALDGREAAPPNANAAGETKSPNGATETLETVRIDIGEADILLQELSQTTANLASVRREADELTRSRQVAELLCELLRAQHSVESSKAGKRTRGIAEDLMEMISRAEQRLMTGIDQVEKQLAVVSDLSARLRLASTSVLNGPAQRVVRDAAKSLQKPISLLFEGGEVRLDGQVIVALQTALLHLLRNAVAHGIEAPSQRRAAGKPETGTIVVRFELRGKSVTMSCSDDGAGVDFETVRQVAAERGLLQVDREPVGGDVLLELLFSPKLSTTHAVGQVSGRGIGLDVVRTTARQLKGDVDIRTTPGLGTIVTLCVPVSLSAIEALRVEVHGQVVAVPLDCVRKTMRIAGSEVARSPNGNVIVFEGGAIPFVPLAELLEPSPESSQKQGDWSVLVISDAAKLAAIGVARVLGSKTVVVRALPSAACANELISGACLDAEGSPDLVLDPTALVRQASSHHAPGRDYCSPTRPPILVIDDSLTTRVLEQSILESAGYRVELAVSGEEALEKAHLQEFGLFLVDVEMPGIDGYELIRRTKADPLLRAIPSILVSSRSSPEDLRRGEAVGAHSFIIKGEFDQGVLLRTIRELIG